MSRVGAGLRRLAAALGLAVRHGFALDASAAADRGWRTVHRVALALMGACAVLAIVGPRVPLAAPLRIRLLTLAPIALSAALAMWLLERVTSAVYARPLRREAIAHSIVVRHPMLVAWPFAALLHFATVSSVEALLLTQTTDASAALRAIATTLLVLTALPFWFIVFHVPALVRAARAVREDARPWWARVRGRTGQVVARLRMLITPLREIADALRARRARRLEDRGRPGA